MGVAHNNLETDASPTKTTRNGYAEDFATEFNRRKIDEGVDADAWALNDGVNLGGNLETYQRQEPGLRQQTNPGQVRQIQAAADAPSLSETIPTGWTPIVTSSISISMPPRTIDIRSKNTLAATYTQAASPQVRSHTPHARWRPL